MMDDEGKPVYYKDFGETKLFLVKKDIHVDDKGVMHSGKFELQLITKIDDEEKAIIIEIQMAEALEIAKVIEKIWGQDYDALQRMYENSMIYNADDDDTKRIYS